MALQQFAGNVAIISYASSIFSDAGQSNCCQIKLL